MTAPPSRSRVPRGGRAPGWRRVLALLLALGAVVAALPAAAQDEDLEDVFGGMGTATTVDESETPAETPEGAGTVAGRVYDGESGAPIAGVTVIINLPAPAGGTPDVLVRTTGAAGDYEFPSVPAGSYSINFSKSGYRPATMTGFQVIAGQVNAADFPLPPLPADAGDEVLDLDPFVAEASVVSGMMAALDIRMESDLQLNVMSAEDLSRYAASDVADALKRVAGVNIVEGQFAIIRGLEDRYSSTTYNSAPVPSPDPDRQSVQLDLFPSEVVNNLQVSKTFAPWLPSNSSGGSIDIVTTEYPEEFELKLSVAGGFNENALGRFLQYDPDNPVGYESSSFLPVNADFNGYFGGRHELFGREFRFKGVGGWGRAFGTSEGTAQDLEPKAARKTILGGGRILAPGDLSLGQLSLEGGLFEYTQSEEEQQGTAYAGLGWDWDRAGLHKFDASGFYTQKTSKIVELYENGYFTNYDYDQLALKTATGQPVQQSDYNGFATLSSWLRKPREIAVANDLSQPYWNASFNESYSFLNERQLWIAQINGDHTFDFLDDLHLTWAGNTAQTTQTENAFGSRYWFEADDPTRIPSQYPVRPFDLGPGQFQTSDSGLTYSANDVKETQWFARTDLDYDFRPIDPLLVELRGGLWYEYATRDVTSQFVPSFTQDGQGQFWVPGPTPFAMGRSILSSIDPLNLVETTTDQKREISAANLAAKLSFWDQVDLLGGARFEDILIESNNDAFIPNQLQYGAPATLPSLYVLFDRLDNPARNEVSTFPPPGTTFNDEIIGADVPHRPCTPGSQNLCVDFTTQAEIQQILNGRIDQNEILPSASLVWRLPWSWSEGARLSAAYSQTVARPSFRELGYYQSVLPGTGDVVVGNPQLQLSNVTSYDARGEWVYGAHGDLVAISGFYKEIEDPVEQIVLRNPNDGDFAGGQFRTFFNNPSTANLWGIELEARKNLGVLAFGQDLLGFLDYFSIGGNFTYIDAEVERSPAEIQRSTPYFGVPPGTPEVFSELAPTRRLFGQPEWIANVDLNFEQPDWGTSLTIAYFAISDILDAAGSAFINRNGIAEALTIDEYTASYGQLDLVFSQEIWRGLALKISVKNLTDSERGIIYDPSQTDTTYYKYRFREGRNYKFSLSYSF